MAKKEKLYFIIHKPFGVLSQFSDEDGNPGLGSIFELPKDVYPIGRLDKDSEGLLILSNDKKLNHLLLDPKNQHSRTYWVEVDGLPDEKRLDRLEKGLDINLKGKMHHTAPCEAKTLNNVPFDEREPPVNRIKHPFTAWMEVKLTEGKNRQVRRMTAKINHPTLRLVRVAIEDLLLGDLSVGGIIRISEKAIYRKLKIPI